MEAAATLSGSGLITGAVTQQFDVDAAFVDSIGNAQQAAGLAPDHVVSSFSGPLMVASPNLQRLLDAAGNPVISGKDFPDIRVKGEADEKLVLYVFGRSDIESGGMVDESFAITLMGDVESSNQPLVEGPETSSASLMGMVGFLVLSVRRRGGLLKEKASPVLVDSSLDGW